MERYKAAMETLHNYKIFDIVVIIICITIIVLLVTYLIRQFTKGRCPRTGKSSLSGIGRANEVYQHPLREYYIKTSYNSCSAGQFQNDWVSLCALENVIQQGCRVLDFEVYQVDGKAVVATSNSIKYTEKGTYNSLSIDSVMKTVADKAVNNTMDGGNACPNPSDPLFLHFRIKTNHIEVYKQIADAIRNHLGYKLLSNQYSYENDGKNLGLEILTSLIGKVIIMVDKIENNHIRDTDMYELVNIIGKSAFLRSLSYDDIVYTPDMDELIDYNKQNMTFGYPNLLDGAKNYDSINKIHEYGVQMFGMCFQINDTYLQAYNQKFSTAFLRKPLKLRYQAVNAEEPTKISEDLSPAYKTYETNYYNFKL